VALVLPWIVVNEGHFFLLNFDKLELHLAFVKFDMQELYLLPFLLMILFLGIFGMTVMGGRVFCGWICPQTIFRVIYRDLIETKILKLRKRIKNKQLEPDMSIFQNKVKKTVAVLIWVVLSFVASANLLWFFVPPEDFFSYLMDPFEHIILFGTLLTLAIFLIYDIIFLKEDYCVYVCPYSRVQSVLYDENTVMALYDTNRGGHIYDENKVKQFTKQKDIQVNEPHAECTACESCVTVCPTHIDIRKGLQLECINCLECVDACTVVMGKLGKPSLVNWSSEYETIDRKGETQYFRPMIIA
jgi:cytochrome c oxidase accessory protein FixG